MPKKKLNVQIKVLHNKSRKGKYLYITSGGKSGRYYKLDNDKYADAYIAFYKDKYLKKKAKGTIKQYLAKIKPVAKTPKIIKKKRTALGRTAEQVLAGARKSAKLEDIITPGIGFAHISNVLTVDSVGIRKAAKQAVADSVLDTKWLNQITLPENMRKLSKYLSYEISMIDEDGEEIGNMQRFGVSPDELVNEIKAVMVAGDIIKLYSQHGDSPLTKVLKSMGFKSINDTSEERKGGTLAKVRVNIRFASNTGG